MNLDYSVQRMRDYDTGRFRWAVLHGPTRTWHIPSRYGRKAADRLCHAMQRFA